MSKENEEENQEDGVKVILIGESGVGKTNLINIAIGDNFSENEKSTTASTLSLKKIKLNNKEYNLDLWDTIGQEQYRQLTKIFFNNSKIVIFVYDITNKESFKALPGWKKDVEEQLGDDYIKGVVANKSDLYLEEEVPTEEGQEYANNIEAKFLLVSAKKDDPKKFEDFLRVLLEEYLSTKKGGNSGRFSITRESVIKQKKSNCCK
jgi:small GTP-binding protein